MTRQTAVQWTCNRCPREAQTYGTIQPAGWVGIAVTQPGVPEGEPQARQHLCHRCAPRLDALLTQVATPEPEPQEAEPPAPTPTPTPATTAPGKSATAPGQVRR